MHFKVTGNLPRVAAKINLTIAVVSVFVYQKHYPLALVFSRLSTWVPYGNMHVFRLGGGGLSPYALIHRSVQTSSLDLPNSTTCRLMSMARGNAAAESVGGQKASMAIEQSGRTSLINSIIGWFFLIIKFSFSYIRFIYF